MTSISLLTRALRECFKIFNNCSSIIHSYLFKHNDILINVEFKNGLRFKLPLYAISSILVLAIRKFNIDPFKFNVKDNKLYYGDREVILDDSSSVLLSLTGWIRKDKIWIYNNIKIRGYEKRSYDILFKTFNLLVYDRFDVEDREVVDVGANIGDSPIFFALKGAKKVYAFEPLPLAYQEMLENIKLNQLEDKIVAINAAVGSKEGYVKVPSNTTDQGFRITGVGDVEIPIYSLDKVVNMLSDPYLIKMNCEGCEVDLILNTDSILKFDKIIFEHHAFLTGVSVKKLLEKLSDYKCYMERRRLTISEKDIGLVYCSRNK